MTIHKLSAALLAGACVVTQVCHTAADTLTHTQQRDHAVRAGDPVCPTSDADKYDCYPWGATNATLCAAHGCCWQPSNNPGVPWCFYGSQPAPAQAQCALVSAASRVDCHPEPDASPTACQARGCCWSAPQAGKAVEGVAYCYFPHTPGYSASAPKPKPAGNGFTSSLSLMQRGPYGNDISPVALDVTYETQTQLHFKLFDPNAQRWEPPVPLTPPPAQPPATTDYVVSVTTAPDPFAIVVTRRSNGKVLFDTRVAIPGANTTSGGVTTNGLIFEDQYLELSTALPVPSGPDGGIHLYGLAEHIVPLQLPSDGQFGQIFTMFAKDQGTPVHNPSGGTGLYGSHPFYLALDPATGEAFGVLLFNANGMDILVQRNALTYRVIGGVLDFYIFTGPTPADVISQYQALVGTPRMPPRWGLGFHLCRWGYDNMTYMHSIWQGMLDNQMPQESQWQDIDYMDQYLDFTTDPQNFPIGPMKSWVDEMHNQYGQKYVLIFDPGISSVQPAGTYPAWDEGVQQDVFIRDENNDILIGKVWPGLVGYPDFFAPNAPSWWHQQVASFHTQLPFDGMWIDMNEPSNFCDGQCSADSAISSSSEVERPKPQPTVVPAPPEVIARASARQLRVGQGTIPGDPKFPPYLPGRLGGVTLLEQKTVAMTAQQHVGLHYNAHNLYGWGEGVVSTAVMEDIRGKRSLIISRSTFPTTGAHNGHWLGDNSATYQDMYYSIPGIMTMNILGIPLVGSDACGFGGDATTPELCTRWMQLAAFIAPFYRNHNTIGKQEQAPSVFPDLYRSYMRNVMNARLAIVPYMYTLFFHANVAGGAVTQPLWLQFPTDANVAALDTQAMMGPALLVSPVLTQGDVTKQAYFPAARWYDWFTGAPLVANVPGWVTLQAPLSSIPVHVRGGFVVPTQAPNMTTTFTSLNPFTLTVALDANGTASGDIFLDDGEALQTYTEKLYSQVQWSVMAAPSGNTGSLKNSILASYYQPPATATLQQVRVLGVSSFRTGGTARVNGASAAVAYNTTTSVLTISCNVGMLTPLSITWSG